MEPSRFFQIYVVLLLFGVLYSILALKILKRGTKKINILLSGFFLCCAVATLLNLIYATIINEFIVSILYLLTNSFLAYSLIFILNFTLMLDKSKTLISNKLMFLLFSVYAFAIFLSWFIPNGVIINKETDWKPVWSDTYFFYLFFITLFIPITPSIVMSIKIYTRLKDNVIRKRWRFFTVGIIFACLLYQGAMVSHFLNDPIFRSLWAIISFFLVVLSSLFMYYGVGRHL
ncbi:MAG: hypothetical protein EU550_02120 [Promethearchaeota archaeon]|nr:MAG: hypothetical protein EU550_02120 [Candidatus Lokiarchaeota archaeon]